MIYMQVTRGAAGDRDFAYPTRNHADAGAVHAVEKASPAPGGEDGLKVISIPDIRWGRRDIKTVQLLVSLDGQDDGQGGRCRRRLDGRGRLRHRRHLEQRLYRQAATDHHAAADLAKILHGITRAAVLRLRRGRRRWGRGTPLHHRAEAQAADEAFVTSATSFVMPVVEIDGRPVGDGTPGPVTARLREIYIDEMRRAAV
jgi:D-alanine transaminase